MVRNKHSGSMDGKWWPGGSPIWIFKGYFHIWVYPAHCIINQFVCILPTKWKIKYAITSRLLTIKNVSSVPHDCIDYNITGQSNHWMKTVITNVNQYFCCRLLVGWDALLFKKKNKAWRKIMAGWPMLAATDRTHEDVMEDKAQVEMLASACRFESVLSQFSRPLCCVTAITQEQTAGRHMFLILSGTLKGIDDLKATSEWSMGGLLCLFASWRQHGGQ